MLYYSVFFILLAITISPSHCEQEEYYWEEYNGVVPEDAIEGGYNKNGDSIFIGRVKFGDDILVGPIYSNVSHVEIARDQNVESVKSGIKILCGSDQPVDWIKAKSENLHVVLIGKNAVKGGVLHKETVHVGRIFFSDEIKIGWIKSSDLNLAKLTFAHKDTILSSDSYEVLLYDTPRARPRRPSRGRHRGRGH